VINVGNNGKIANVLQRHAPWYSAFFGGREWGC
jgi:hypothetical protein